MLFPSPAEFCLDTQRCLPPPLFHRTASDWLPPRPANNELTPPKAKEGGGRITATGLVCPAHSCMQCQRIVPVYSELAAKQRPKYWSRLFLEYLGVPTTVLPYCHQLTLQDDWDISPCCVSQVDPDILARGTVWPTCCPSETTRLHQSASSRFVLVRTPAE